MFYLKTCINNIPIILHVKGYSKDKSCGVIPGEGIFLVNELYAPNESNKKIIVQKQVGRIERDGDSFVFKFTNKWFKKLIAYDATSGRSNLDGRLWQIRSTAYFNSAGQIDDYMCPSKYMSINYGHNQFMYANAKNPIMNWPSSLRLFSHTDYFPQNEPHTKNDPAPVFRL